MKLPKVTNRVDVLEKTSNKGHGRWYADACGTAFGLEVLGERWAMLIVRELLFGPRRFSDLRSSLPGISAKVLTERLEGLAGWGVLSKKRMPPPSPAQLYELTQWGQLAETAINELGRWAAHSPLHDPTLPLSAASLMSSMNTMQLPDRMAGATDVSIGFQVGEDLFSANVCRGVLTIKRTQDAKGDAVLRAPSAPPIAGALYGDIPLAVLEDEAGLVVEGDRAALEAYLLLFGLPEKIG